MLIVLTGHGPDQTIAERKLSDATWDETVKDVARGEWKDVSGIIQTSTGVDALSLIAVQVMDIWAQQGEPLSDWQKQFVEFNVGIRKANLFMQAAE